MADVYARVSINFKGELKCVMAKRYQLTNVPRVGESIVLDGGIEDCAEIVVSRVRHWIDDEVITVECSFDCDSDGMLIDDDRLDKVVIEEDSQIDKDIEDLNGASQSECDAMFEKTWAWTYYKRCFAALGFRDAKGYFWERPNHAH